MVRRDVPCIVSSVPIDAIDSSPICRLDRLLDVLLEVLEEVLEPSGIENKDEGLNFLLKLVI